MMLMKEPKEVGMGDFDFEDSNLPLALGTPYYRWNFSLNGSKLSTTYH